MGEPLSRPYGTYVVGRVRKPGVETPGYSQISLRDRSWPVNGYELRIPINPSWSSLRSGEGPRLWVRTWIGGECPGPASGISPLISLSHPAAPHK
jgi:hypothetical protein